MALKEKGRWRHFLITGGSDPRDDFWSEFEYALSLVEGIMKAGKEAGMDRVPHYIVGSAFKKEWLKKIRDAGCEAYGIYIEIWDKEKFKLMCPGKQNYLEYDNMVERALDAVEIFGEGNVFAGFVPGVEMAPEPYGFGDDTDTAVNSTLEGFD